jgi:pSer/pThr/pTyr-binding forkhead associated (FHA) protein
MAEVKNIPLEALERKCEGGDTGRLDFRHGDYEGQIYVEEKLIVHAQIASLEGIPALFRLFDWGDAETVWMSGVKPEKATLHLTMEAASLLYAENLQDRADLEAKEKERYDQALATPEAVAGQTAGVESVLKHYTISLECTDPTQLVGGFKFSDATKSSYVIGSSEDCDVILRHPSVDPLHCGMILERGSVLIWDLGAQSGIILNGKPVIEDTLKVGDVMRLGELELRVRFQLRRPTLKPKIEAVADPTAVAIGEAAAPQMAQGPVSATGTMPMPKIRPAPKEIPKGPITYDKVAKQIRGRIAGHGFLEKLTSLFGHKKK